MNIGIFGGTFDPVHRGHTEVARAAADELQLTKVLFVPAGRPPHRRNPTEAGYEHRYRMVELASKQDTRFVPSRFEDPSVGSGPHYSIDTFRRVKETAASGDRLLFVLGADAFAEIKQWYRWLEVVGMVEFIVAGRAAEIDRRPDVPEGARVHWLEGVDVPISSTELRERLKRRKPVDDWLAPEVAAYIRRHGLYGNAVLPRTEIRGPE